MAKQRNNATVDEVEPTETEDVTPTAPLKDDVTLPSDLDGDTSGFEVKQAVITPEYYRKIKIPDAGFYQFGLMTFDENFVSENATDEVIAQLEAQFPALTIEKF